MKEQASVFLRNLLKPYKGLDNRFAMEVLILSVYPIGKHHVEVIHYFFKFGFAEFVVVVVPPSDLTFVAQGQVSRPT